MITKPKISVVMPVYNGEKYLSTAIDSILNQTFPDFEFIIINDASTDTTSDIIRKYQKKDKRIISINNEKNLGIGGTLNKGFTYAKTQYVARMDADDISEPERLEKQYKLISSNKKLGVVGGYILIINEQNDPLLLRKYLANSNDLKNHIFRYSPFAHPATMIRLSVFNEFGGYDPSKSPSEDLDLWIKIGTKYEFGNVPRVILNYRIYEASASNSNLRKVEINTIKMRFSAWKKYGYKPHLIDVIYNLLQFVSLWFIGTRLRLKLFNYLRSRGFI
jgi:glycosyltransferase involved in cell wall biosynthesis